MQTVRNDVERMELVSIHDLVPFQGDLKELSEENYQKLKSDILEYGFSEPFTVWLNPAGSKCLMNGHQRLKTLFRMQQEGYQIPELPMVIVRAKDEQEAAMKVLSLTSQFGVMTQKGLYDFIKVKQLKIDQIAINMRFPEINLTKFKIEFFGGDKEKEIDNVEPEGDPQFIVAVTCKDESEMQMMYDELSQRGFECKLIT